MKHFFLGLLLLPLAVLGKERFSYLYIQGDKQTPFYVKLEDGMQPRYGKNYCIIPQLASGPTHIEILFQQNVFPSQQFTVLIPESGSRGFLLVKRDTSYALYDLQQGFYLPAGNEASDDHLPTTGAIVSAPEPIVDTPQPKTVARVKERPNKIKIVKKEKPQRKPATHKAVAVAKSVPASSGPDFIPDMELSKPGETSENTVKTSVVTKPAAILNSDCPSAISSADFKPIFNAMAAVSSDEERLGYILDKMNLCYESWQARALAQMLSGDAARFTLLKRIYPRISDQASFPLLDDLFSTETWKAEFAKLVHH